MNTLQQQQLSVNSTSFSEDYPTKTLEQDHSQGFKTAGGERGPQGRHGYTL